MTMIRKILCKLIGHNWGEWYDVDWNTDIHSRRYCERCDERELRWNAFGPFDGDDE